MLDTWKSSFQIDKQYTTIAAVTINHIVVAAIILYISLSIIEIINHLILTD